MNASMLNQVALGSKANFTYTAHMRFMIIMSANVYLQIRLCFTFFVAYFTTKNTLRLLSARPVPVQGTKYGHSGRLRQPIMILLSDSPV